MIWDLKTDPFSTEDDEGLRQMQEQIRNLCSPDEDEDEDDTDEDDFGDSTRQEPYRGPPVATRVSARIVSVRMRAKFNCSDFFVQH